MTTRTPTPTPSAPTPVAAAAKKAAQTAVAPAPAAATTAAEPDTAKKTDRKAPATKSAKTEKPVKADKSTKTTKAAAKSEKAEKVARPEKTDKAEKTESKEAKPKKPKLVRDSFTFPKDEYASIEVLKARGTQLGHAAKKSELLRAGLKLLASLNDQDLLKALQAVPTIKTGRPAKK